VCALIEYRPFRNSDPPFIADIWRGQAPLRGLAQPMSPQLLEECVFAKPYFDRDGLILAMDGEQPVGFVHAGFGPSSDGRQLSRTVGTTCMLMAVSHSQRSAVAAGLVAESERYLRSRGADVLYGGSLAPCNPFYTGLYGGAELPGVLSDDELMQTILSASGYVEHATTVILQRDLVGFRPPVDRHLMKLKRAWTIEAAFDPPAANWWEACVWGQMDRSQFQLFSREGGRPCGEAICYEIKSMAGTWGVTAVGLVKLEIDESCRRQGLGTYLAAEALHQLHVHGAALAEVQMDAANEPVLALCGKLGFEEVERGTLFRKDASGVG